MSKETGKTINCATCGKPKYVSGWQIKGNKSGKFFCNNGCRSVWVKEEKNKFFKQTYNDRMQEVKCEYCNSLFDLPNYRVDRNKKFFCNNICKQKWYKEKCRCNIKCSYCGKDMNIIKYSFDNYNNHFCSKECESKFKTNKMVGENNPSYKGRFEVQCNHCDVLFYVPNHKYIKWINGNIKLYCSSECGLSHRNILLTGKTNPKFKERIIEKCSFCGEMLEIEEWKYSCSRTKRFFCNRICHNSFAVKENSYNWNGGPNKVSCIICGNIKFVDGWSFNKYNFFLCSEDCKKKYWNENPSPNIGKKGEENHNWNGGTAFSPYPFEFNSELKYEIRERDGFKCRICGRKERNIAHAVHHIDYDKNNSDKLNLITLCSSCHTKTNSDRDFWIFHFTNHLI